MAEIPRININPVKETLKIKTKTRVELDREGKEKQDLSHKPTRKVMSTTLPIYMHGATLPTPDAGDSPSWLGGVLKRAGCKPPEAAPIKRQQLRSFVKSWCHKNLTPLDPAGDYSAETWIEQTSYTAARKKQLQLVYKKLWSPNIRMTKNVKVVSSFIKDETYPEYKYPRMINSRSDKFKCYSGPLFEAISHEVFRNEWFIKMIPVCQRPEMILKRIMAEGKRYYSTDYTSFEAHFTKEVMQTCEFVLYNYMVKNLPEEQKRQMENIKNVLVGKNHCVFRQHGVAEMDATRMSGEMNTSLGNGFANLMITLFLAKGKGAGTVLGYVEGDDGLFTFENEAKAPQVEDYKRLGFTIKMESTTNLNEASFCGNVFDCTDLLVLTDPLKALAGFGWTSKRYANATPKVKMQLLRSKALSMAHQYNGMPVLSKFARRIVHLTRSVTVRKTIYDVMDSYKRKQALESLGPLPVERIPSHATRALVDKLYGIRPEDQIKLEKLFEERLELGMSFEIIGVIPSDHLWCEVYREYTAEEPRSLAVKLERDPRKYIDYLETIYPGARELLALTSY